MKIKNIFIRKVVGWIFLVIGLFGWIIPIPVVPFFLLFFVGLYILNYDQKLLSFLKKHGIKTDKFEERINKIRKNEQQ